jgi:hypothetical protein
MGWFRQTCRCCGHVNNPADCLESESVNAGKCPECTADLEPTREHPHYEVLAQIRESELRAIDREIAAGEVRG